MRYDTRKLAIVLLIAVAVLSTVIGVLISRRGGDRGRQLQEQPVSGTEVSVTQRTCPAGCAYLPMVAANAGTTQQSRSDAQTAAIDVVAQGHTACEANEARPVAGARITVVTDHDSRVGVTDAEGHALFEAANDAAVVQIEWPAGYLPCPDSRPIVELPSGAGEVTFTASAPAYP